MSTTLNIYFFLKMSMIDFMIIFSIRHWYMQAVRFFFVHSLDEVCFDIQLISSNVAILKLILYASEVLLWLHSVLWSFQDCLLWQAWKYKIAVNSSSFLKVYVQVRMCCNLFFNQLFFFTNMNLSHSFVILCWLYWMRVSSSIFRIHIIERMRLFYSQHDIRQWYINFIKSYIFSQAVSQLLFRCICWLYKMQPFRILLKDQNHCISCKQVWTHFSSIVNVIWFFIVRVCMILHHILEFHQDWINNWLNLQDIILHWILCNSLHFGLDFIDFVQIWFHLFRKVLADCQCLLLEVESLCIRINLTDIKLFLQTFEYFMK